VTSRALAAGVVIHGRVVAHKAERPGGRQWGDGGRRVTSVARDVRVDRWRVGLDDALGPVTRRAAAAGLVVLRMAAPAGGRGIGRCHRHELRVAGRAAEVGVTRMWEGDRPIARGFSRCGDGEVEIECLGEAVRLVTPGAVVPRRIGVVANLATTRRLERE